MVLNKIINYRDSELPALSSYIGKYVNENFEKINKADIFNFEVLYVNFQYMVRVSKELNSSGKIKQPEDKSLYKNHIKYFTKYPDLEDYLVENYENWKTKNKIIQLENFPDLNFIRQDQPNKQP